MFNKHHTASSQRPKNVVPLKHVQNFEALKKRISRMQQLLIKTACKELHLCEETDLALYSKKDFRQITGSCYARSALSTFLNLSIEQLRNGVITALEEEALPLCYFGEKFNIPITIVLPITTLLSKICALERYQYTNAEVFIKGNNSDEAERFASELATMKNMHCIKRDNKARFIDYGTIGIRIAEQVTNLGVMLYDEPIFTNIPSVIAVLKPSVKVVIAADKSINSLSKSFSKTFQSVQLFPSTLPALDSASNQIISTNPTSFIASVIYTFSLSGPIFTSLQTLSSAIKSTLSSVSAEMLFSSTGPTPSSASVEILSCSTGLIPSFVSVEILSCSTGLIPSSASVEILSCSNGPITSSASVEILSCLSGPTSSSASIEILSCSNGPITSSASVEILSCLSEPTLSSASVEILSCSNGPTPSSASIEILSCSTGPTPSSASVEILSCSSEPTPSSASVEILSCSSKPIPSSASDQLLLHLTNTIPSLLKYHLLQLKNNVL